MKPKATPKMVKSFNSVAGADPRPQERRTLPGPGMASHRFEPSRPLRDEMQRVNERTFRLLEPIDRTR